MLGAADMAGTDCFVDAAYALRATRSIRVMLSVALPTRSPLQTVNATSALASVGEGRIALGLGAGSKSLNEQQHGVPFDPPLSRLRDFAAASSAMLRGALGEPVSYEGPFYRLAGSGLGLGPVELPIVIGAHGPKMVGLAAEVADGVIFHIFTPLSTMASRLEAISDSKPWVSVGRPCATHTDRDRALLLARAELLGVFAIPRFAPRLVELAGVDVAQEVSDRIADGKTAHAAEAITEDIVEEFVTIAEPKAMVGALNAIEGVDVVVPVSVGIFGWPFADALGISASDYGGARASLVGALVN